MKQHNIGGLHRKNMNFGAVKAEPQPQHFAPEDGRGGAVEIRGISVPSQRSEMNRTDQNTNHPAGMSPASIFVFALTGGVAVSNLCWAQPLLTEIAKAFSVSEGAAGMLVTFTQIGYALGVFLLVPLGDVVNRARLIPALMVLSGLSLVLCAFAPGFITLIIGLIAVGLTTVTGQLLTPLAGDLVKPELRGRVVGTIVSGILTGILLSRTVSGVIADHFGWRAVYIIAAAAVFVLSLVMARVLPNDPSRRQISYHRLLGSVLKAVCIRIVRYRLP